MTAGIKANVDGSAAIQVGGTDVITLTSGGAATFVTSPTTVQAGTAAAPSITFSGDTNTGIYSPGADTIAFTEGGVESMRIDSLGNVGIGTSSIGNKLEVAGNIRSSGSISISTAGGNDFISSDGTTSVRMGIGTYGGGALATVGVDGANPLRFMTNSAERARFNATGAFVLAGGTTTANGIGITFPATQSASSNAKTLDDYEEGTWTPSSGISVTGASGRYTKIGRVVQWSCVFTYAASGSGNHAYIGGLPFTCENANASRAGSVISFTDYGSSNITVLFASNDISAFFYNYSGLALTYANLSGKTIYCGGTYLTTT